MIFKKTRERKKLAYVLVIAATVVMTTVTAGRADKVPFPKPDSHKGDWARNHGLHAQVDINEAGQTGGVCLTCHQKNDCIACHSQNMPKDHNNFWRIRGHGITASVNRERCFACHRQDYCIRCHNETAPRNHTGAWRSRHCTWCHFASGIKPADGCGVCHKIAPHTSRPSAHPPIGPQTNCAVCHT